MIDLSSEHLLTLAEAAKTLPGRPSTSSIFRWMSRGIRGVRLESVLLGGRRFVSDESLARFAAAVTAVAAGERPPIRTTREREREIKRAEAEMADVRPRRMNQ